MAAKLLHSLADDNPDLQKQIGCMTGIFQIFDQHQLIAGRRLTHKRLPPPPPPANTQFNNFGLERDATNIYNRQTVDEMNFYKSINEKRVSTESSRASFSSSCSSSMSSLDRPTQPETSCFDRNIFPETPLQDPVTNPSSTSPHFGQQPIDLRDVVKDSMYREARSLSVKTVIKEEKGGSVGKRRHSPRPLRISKPASRSYQNGSDLKQDVPIELKEPVRVLAKLREGPWSFNEGKELPKSLQDAKDKAFHSTSRDGPLFSYDDREVNRLSFDLRETIKSAPKLKELPRLSLDSREGSVLSSSSRASHILNDMQTRSGNSNEKCHQLPLQASETQKRPPSVVAKLMGLDALPDFPSSGDTQAGQVKRFGPENKDLFTRSLHRIDPGKTIGSSNSSKNQISEPASPRWKTPDALMKPVSRFPNEPAPWRQMDGNRTAQKSQFKPPKVSQMAESSSPSVYGEIERRLKDLEFKQSGKDLRALKQILEAIQAKGLLETGKEEQASHFGTQKNPELQNRNFNQKSRLEKQPFSQKNHQISAKDRVPDNSRNFESPIVIMKPAKLVEKYGVESSSVISIDFLSNLQKIKASASVDTKKLASNSRTSKDQSSKNINRDSPLSSADKKVVSRNTRSVQSSSRPQRISKECMASTLKNSGSVSPRLQQKRLELEKLSRPPTPPTPLDSSKSRRQPNRQTAESVSPGGRLRCKYPNLQPSDDQLSEVSYESISLSYQGDDLSDSNNNLELDLDSKVDGDVFLVEQSNIISKVLSPSKDNMAPILDTSAVQKVKSTSPSIEDELLSELATSAAEHRSPVSVLDNAEYTDDSPSHVNQMSNSHKDGGNHRPMIGQAEDSWKPADCFAGVPVTSEVNRRKLQNVEQLVQKLRKLNSTHDEERTDYIASLCENTNPDHRYISEILLASGLLLRDLGAGLTTFQLHPSGHPINPELFLVLEQTKMSTISKEESAPRKVSRAKPDEEKLHRRIIFDAVNDMLAEKFTLMGILCEPQLKPRNLVTKTLTAHQLLKELCLEIEHLETNKPICSMQDGGDSVKGILCEDVMNRWGSWTTDFYTETSGIVLDIERLIFKDLVDEVVIGDAAGLNTRTRRRRQLFAK